MRRERKGGSRGSPRIVAAGRAGALSAQSKTVIRVAPCCTVPNWPGETRLRRAYSQHAGDLAPAVFRLNRPFGHRIEWCPAGTSPPVDEGALSLDRCRQSTAHQIMTSPAGRENSACEFTPRISPPTPSLLYLPCVCARALSPYEGRAGVRLFLGSGMMDGFAGCRASRPPARSVAHHQRRRSAIAQVHR